MNEISVTILMILGVSFKIEIAMVTEMTNHNSLSYNRWVL